MNIWLASRLLFSKKEMGLISWSTVISISGVTLGSFALIVSVAVLNGFEGQIRSRVVGFESDLRLSGAQLTEANRPEIERILEQSRGVSDYSFFVERNGVILAGDKRALVRVKAVEDENLERVYRIDRISHTAPPEPGFQAHIGERLAGELGLEVGDTFQILSPLSSQLFLGFPSTVTVLVGSIFRTRILQFDDRYCFVPLAVGRRLFSESGGTGGSGVYSGVDIRLSGGASPRTVSEDLTSKLPPGARVTGWKDLHKTLFSAMRMEKLGSTVVLSLIILVASFNIASSLGMLVMEKVREIGILRTMGASSVRIGRVFALQGVLIGGLGLFLGLVSGLGLILVQRVWGVVKLPEQVYFVPSVPVAITWLDIITIVAVGGVLIGISIIYPARAASRLVPMEAVQYEK